MAIFYVSDIPSVSALSMGHEGRCAKEQESLAADYMTRWAAILTLLPLAIGDRTGLREVQQPLALRSHLRVAAASVPTR